jgi:hypothetical protein
MALPSKGIDMVIQNIDASPSNRESFRQNHAGASCLDGEDGRRLSVQALGRDDLREYPAGLRSWGLRPRDLVMVNGAGPYVDYRRPEPGDAE